MGVANVGQPRDQVTIWEELAAAQFKALRTFAKSKGCCLTPAQLPPRLPGAKPGMEVTVYLEAASRRVWKSTFPGKSGFGPFGYQTPAGYLRRLRLSNLIFGDDVAFEGLLLRKEGPGIVTSQSFIQPHPVRFIPTPEEISGFMTGLGFCYDESESLWTRADGVQAGDTHDRNFIRAPDESIIAIDVQPRLLPGFPFEGVRPFQ